MSYIRKTTASYYGDHLRPTDIPWETLQNWEPLRHSQTKFDHEEIWAPEIPWEKVEQGEPLWRSQTKFDHEEVRAHKQQHPGSLNLRIPMAPYLPSCPLEGQIEDKELGNAVRGISAFPSEQKQLSDLPFKIRHKFLSWLVLMLEATYIERARQQGTPVQNVDMSCWSQRFKDKDDSHLPQGGYDSDLWYNRKEIYQGTEDIRHASEHRRDIAIAVLERGMCLPHLFKDEPRGQEIDRVYDLVRRSMESGEQDDLDKALDKALEKFAEIDSVTKLYCRLQYTIEASIFRYTQRYHPELLLKLGWTEPEQGELPEWEENYRYRRTIAKQDSFPDHGDLLSTCLSQGRLLRNSAAHRNSKSKEQIVAAAHWTIRCLMVLGNHKGAIEVEILVEQFITERTQDQVLQRLQGTYFNGPLPPNDDPFARRREEQRRSAISEVLSEVSLSQGNLQKWTVATDRQRKSIVADEESCIPCTPTSDDSLPSRIIVTSPDVWATRSETISQSMHPKLQELPNPGTSVHWERASEQQPSPELGSSWGDDEATSETEGDAVDVACQATETEEETDAEENAVEDSECLLEQDDEHYPESISTEWQSADEDISAEADWESDDCVPESTDDCDDDAQDGSWNFYYDHQASNTPQLADTDSDTNGWPSDATTTVNASDSESWPSDATTAVNTSESASSGVEDTLIGTDQDVLLDFRQYGADEVSAYYAMAGEEMPEKVPIRVRREIRRWWKTPQPQARPRTVLEDEVEVDYAKQEEWKRW